MKKEIIVAMCLTTLGCTTESVEVLNNESISAEDIQLDTAMNVVEEMKKLPLILGENDFGKLKLYKDRTANLDTIVKNLTDYKVSKEAGHQDGPDYVYFNVAKDTNDIAMIKMNDLDESIIDKILVFSEEVSDEYGAHIGMSYNDLIKLRPGLELMIGDHFNVFLSEVGSPCGYLITGDFEGVDRKDFTKEELQDWQVERLIWFNPDF